MIFRRGQTFYTEHTDERGVRRRLASKARTRAEAELLEAELKVQADRVRKGLAVGALNPTKLTLLEAAEKYKARQKNEGTRKVLGYTIEKHLERTHLGEMLLEHITPAIIDDYLESMTVMRGRGEDRSEEPATPATMNRVRSAISGCYRTVKKLKLFHGENPARDVEQREEPEHVDRLIDPSLVPELLADAPDERWRLFLMIAAYTGMRKSEIKRLDLSIHYDARARVITVKGKRNKVRRVGVHKDLAPKLDAALKAGQPTFDDRSWQKAHMIVKGVLEDDEAVFHGLRHTWASRLIECGARDGVVEYMGWGRRTSSTFRRAYLDIPNSRLVEEIDKLTWPAVVDEEIEATAQIRHSPSKRSS